MGWPDAYTKKAHDQGYHARSVYKLEDLDKKFRLLRKGKTVLDLGCYPGSFSQYALQKGCTVVGVDVQKVQGVPGLKFHKMDVFDDTLLRTLSSYGCFDVVFSDMAPRTTGNRKLDQARSAALVDRAWEIACAVAPGGRAVIKYFQGSAEKSIKEWKVKCVTYKPKASRAESYEMFVVAEIPGENAPKTI